MSTAKRLAPILLAVSLLARDAPAGATAGGLIVGSVLGGRIGWAMQTDRWEEFSLRDALGFEIGRPGEGAGLAILVRF